MELIDRVIYLLLSLGLILQFMTPQSVNGILSSNEKSSKNDSKSIEGGVILIPTNATDIDLAEISSRIRLDLVCQHTFIISNIGNTILHIQNVSLFLQ